MYHMLKSHQNVRSKTSNLFWIDLLSPQDWLIFVPFGLSFLFYHDTDSSLQNFKNVPLIFNILIYSAHSSRLPQGLFC